MRKIYSLLLFSALTLVGCSSDNDTPEQAFELEATGTVAEQTPEEAKKTINGKWTVGGSSSKFSAAKGLNCTFVGIEFTDDRFAIAIEVAGYDDYALAYGTYELTEDSDGNVASVDLYENIDGTSYKIATLTDIVVTESGSELNASFDVVFNIPADYEDWPCGVSLSGDYTASKDEPVSGAEQADEDSNFAKLVNTWVATGYTNSYGNTLADAFNSFCIDEETGEEYEDCEVPTSLEVSFSAYGSYIFTAADSSGEIVEIYVDSWEFNNTDQTEILIDGEEVLSIDELTDTSFVVSLTETFDGETFTETYTFSKAN
ncbi:MAG: hypothetical protein ABF261_02555 [Candidatus Arcticimaribacter sp.]